MGSKYQIKSKEGIVTFDKKEDFLKRCRLEFSANRKSSIQYSFDFGDTWNYILNFPNDRQTIESQKKPQNENRNHSTKSESKSGWGTYLIYVLALWGGLSLINNNVTPIGFVNKINTELFGSNQEVVPNTQNNEETITEDNSPDGINEESTQNELNSQSESNDNSSSNTYQEPERQKQLINCRYCNGRGIETCLKCNGNGTTKCDNCYTGTITDVVNGGRKTCYICNGTVRINCKNCYGKGNKGRCSSCGGRGQVQQ
jgi:hypothetical protein